MSKFFGKRDRLCCSNCSEICLKICGEILYDLHRHCRIFPAQYINGGQRIKDKMRTNLLHQAGNLCISQLCFLFSQDALPLDGAAYKAEALNEQVRDDPQHEKWGIVQGAGSGKIEQINAKHQQKRNPPDQLPSRGFSLKQHDQMQHGSKHAVGDENTV